MEVDTSAETNSILDDIATDAKPLVSERARDIHADPLDDQMAECKQCDSNIQENFSDPPSNFSKRQLKKQSKLQKRLKMQSEWKLQRKLKNKERKLRHKMLSVDLEKPKITPMASSNRKFTVVIDFSYDELMSPKDLIKCGNQVIRCYSANRRSTNPLQLHFCNFTGKIEAEIGKNNGYKKWDIHFHDDTYLEVFNKSSLVYLTSESRNVLETLEEDKVYIIGGLVDHNAHKGVSYQKAVYEGISHAQLPIKKYIQMKSRSVLTINHVFEILLKVSNGKSWSETLRDVVPPRMFETQLVKKNEVDSPKTSEDEEEKDEENIEKNDYETESVAETTNDDVSMTN